MKEIIKMLEEREKQLIKIKKEKEKSLLKVPEGSLRVCSSHGKIQYYHRTDPKDFNGTYISSKEKKLAQKLAQKDYDQRVLKVVEKELQAIEKYRGKYPEKCAEEIYETMHMERKKMITPILETTEQFVANLESLQYTGKKFYEEVPEFYTAKNERVRSKSEVIIADTLNREGIPYRYEYPVYLGKTGYVYPDFTVLHVRTRKEFFYEHFGMMDDPDYAEKAVQKLLSYAQNGIFQGENLVVTYETRKLPLNQKMVLRVIQQYFK